ncbi:uncharacterized protein LOC131888923 [Tigriopus californicus]|uniref:uncharacterized protein LOC131888923 n=1 Tax=Tigriopus californicus TaxID=6832 RepID=UPI0027DA16FD|nr:uncharacterized protein LOC131888923 [Tigriopus californicus]XP_059093862.1 uncharacterized protein LOC131888923 [Tigriopus californicus]
MNERETLHHRLFETRTQNKAMRTLLREQKERSRQLFAALAAKLQEKEAQIERIQSQRESELSFLAQEVTFLQGNMLKEQKRLKEIIQDQESKICRLEMELDKCKKHHNIKSKISKSKLLQVEDQDMDTPSSEDCSPKSSFSKGPKIEIKPRIPKIPEHGISSKESSPPAKTNFNSSLHPSRSSGTATEKPPVPSRAGVNRKLLHKPPPPAPPARASSIGSKPRRIRTTERQDSGRDSDGFGTDVDRSNSLKSNGESADSLMSLRRLSMTDTATTSEEQVDQLSPAHSRVSGDEGFCSSHEDKAPPLPPPRTTSSPGTPTVPRLAVNHHRDVQKPSDVKHRSKFKSSTSSLGVLEEHQVTNQPGQPVATVRYWTEPYL